MLAGEQSSGETKHTRTGPGSSILKTMLQTGWKQLGAGCQLRNMMKF